MIGEGLDPPRPASRIDNDLLSWLRIFDPTCNRVDALTPTLCRRRNLAELNRRSSIGWMRLTAS
jgi:hypothetical protein